MTTRAELEDPCIPINALEACLIRHITGQLRTFKEVPIDKAVLFDIRALPGHYGKTPHITTSLNMLCADHGWRWRTDEINYYIYE
jgi:hypothetical protein